MHPRAGGSQLERSYSGRAVTRGTRTCPRASDCWIKWQRKLTSNLDQKKQAGQDSSLACRIQLFNSPIK